MTDHIPEAAEKVSTENTEWPGMRRTKCYYRDDGQCEYGDIPFYRVGENPCTSNCQTRHNKTFQRCQGCRWMSEVRGILGSLYGPECWLCHHPEHPNNSHTHTHLHHNDYPICECGRIKQCSFYIKWDKWTLINEEVKAEKAQISRLVRAKAYWRQLRGPHVNARILELEHEIEHLSDRLNIRRIKYHPREPHEEPEDAKMKAAWGCLRPIFAEMASQPRERTVIDMLGEVAAIETQKNKDIRALTGKLECAVSLRRNRRLAPVKTLEPYDAWNPVYIWRGW